MKRVISTSMILFFLVGIIGLNYDIHYCCGKVHSENLSFISSDLSCGMGALENASIDDSLQFKKHCCDNKHLRFDIDDDYNNYQAIDSDFDGAPSLVQSELNGILFANVRLDYEFIGYSPPPIDEDIIILHQTFLI